MKTRLLVTARDVAAALHLIEVVRVARQRDDLDLWIVAQSPAAEYFVRAGVKVHKLDLPATKRRDSPEAMALLQIAGEILETFRPDYLLCGLSTPFDGGIDEAIQAVRNCPCYVMQDFWGEVNAFFGKGADLYLALDGEGVRLTGDRHGARAAIVGSPRHSAYSHIDTAAIRQAQRGQLKVRESATVIGFFGQALHALDGYKRTIQNWAAAVRRIPGDSVPLYRPHPRETNADRDWTLALLRDAGLDCVLSQSSSVEDSLLACDVVCSAFSNCTYDAAYLNYFSQRPLITPVSMLFDDEIISYFHRMVRLSEFPYLKAGLAMAVRTPEEMTEKLQIAASAAERERYWLAARQLPNPAKAPERVLQYVLSGLPATAGI